MKKLIATLSISALAFSLVAGTHTMYASSTTPAASAVSVNNQSQVTKQIDEFLQSKQFNGTVLVAKDGKVVMSKGYGESNFTTHAKNEVETSFRIGSLTKSVTAVAVMQLVEQGKLKLGDPINKFIPDFPNGDKITVHQLLSHTSGIGDAEFFDVGKKDMAGYYSQAKMLETAKRAAEKLDSEPGTKFEYSNTGYHLLGYIIEEASHTTWDNYVNEYIFKPTQMTNSGVEINEPVLPNHAVGVDADGKPAMFADISYAKSAGSLYSTVGDVLKFDQALMSGKLISKKSFDMMATPVKDGYGYGLIDGVKLQESSDWKYHQGDIPGFHAFNAFNVKENMQVILMTNKDINPEEFGLNIAKGVLDIFAKAPTDPGKEKSNQQVYLEYLIATGTSGQAAWAEDQLTKGLY